MVIATGLTAPLNLVYPHVHPFPSTSFAHAQPVHIVHAVPAVETRIHYAETPVVVGHSAQILKPNLNPFVVAPLVAPSLAVAPQSLAYAAIAAPAVLNLKASVPTGDAPYMDQLITKHKVLAPVRTISDVTPQVHVQHPTKINVQKVAFEVPVATPYALPVPVPVAPHYEIHNVHTPTLTVVA